MTDTIKIRKEEARDHKAVREVHITAFGNEAEANLVENLRQNAEPFLSLVAENDDGSVIGHIMFSPMRNSNDDDINMMGLAPLAVLPEVQSQGIGSRLCEAGVQMIKDTDFKGIVVLGHADYYPRFGFEVSTKYGIACEYEVPAENFMVFECNAGALDDVSGTVKYHPAFAEM